MLPDAMKQRIAEACVTVHMGEGFGRGVLVGGQLILTAAHNMLCALDRSSSLPLASALVGLALGDHVMLELTTTCGVVHVAPYMLDPATDIAVLGPLDNQVCWDQAEAYEAWTESVTPVSICTDDFPFPEPFPAAVYTHHRTWLAGTAKQRRAHAPCLSVTVSDGIEGGTSGSPIVNMQGAIVGIVSQFGGTEADALTRGQHGPAPRPHLTVPPWVLREILGGEAHVDHGE